MTNQRWMTLTMPADDFEPIALACLSAVIGGGTLDVVRVWGGGSAEKGWSWAPIDELGPGYRDRAGLPNVNSAHSVTMGTVDERDIIMRRAALPLDGARGGMPELIINPSSVRLTGATSLGAPM